MSIIQFYRIVLQFSEALFYVLNANFKFKMLTRAPVVCKNVLSVSDDNKTCGFPYHIIDQNKQQNMWVFLHHQDSLESSESTAKINVLNFKFGIWNP